MSGKLVRDRIPEIIKNEGKVQIVRILSGDEYLDELDKKLIEEFNEYKTERDFGKSESTLEELADMLEVIFAYCDLIGDYTIEDLFAIRNDKYIKRGGFKDKIYLSGNE